MNNLPFEIDFPSGVYGTRGRLKYFKENGITIQDARSATETEMLLWAILQEIRESKGHVQSNYGEPS